MAFHAQAFSNLSGSLAVLEGAIFSRRNLNSPENKNFVYRWDELIIYTHSLLSVYNIYQSVYTIHTFHPLSTVSYSVLQSISHYRVVVLVDYRKIGMMYIIYLLFGIVTNIA